MALSFCQGDTKSQLSDLSGCESLSAWTRLLYSELRQLAVHHSRRETADDTLEPTALVHEAFIRLSRNGPRVYQNRGHFFGVASRAMREILVEMARRRRAEKRGGRRRTVPLHHVEAAAPEMPDYLAVDAALKRLSRFDPRLAKIVELRVFAHLSAREAARVMKMGESTVRKEWAVAKAWLQKELRDLIL
jgi:RNA polymerase sigma-70 factor (ECF subfamily)